MPEELFWVLFIVFIAIPAILICTIFLNPDFWQGFRNSKFLDELDKEDFDAETKEVSKPTKRM